MTTRLIAFLEFEQEAQAVDAYNQMRARAINTRVVGLGGPEGRQSYCRVETPTPTMFYVDRFQIIRDGEYVAPPQGQYPQWVQPTGAQDAYPLLDAAGEPTRVTWQGRNYENTSAANIWAPNVFGWTDLGPA